MQSIGSPDEHIIPTLCVDKKKSARDQRVDDTPSIANRSLGNLMMHCADNQWPLPRIPQGLIRSVSHDAHLSFEASGGSQRGLRYRNGVFLENNFFVENLTFSLQKISNYGVPIIDNSHLMLPESDRKLQTRWDQLVARAFCLSLL